MLSNQITSIIQSLKTGGQSAPLLLSEWHVCEVFYEIYGTETLSLDDLAERSITDFLYYDCSDKENEYHKADKIREQASRLYQKPAGDILIALFRNIEFLTEVSANALLRLFEDVPTQVLILVTSRSPQKIIPTLQSRMVMIDGGVTERSENPFQSAIDDFLHKKPETIFQITLASSKERKFSREDALWIVQGLQDAIECGRLSVRYAKMVQATRIQLETTNTIAKYLIDQLLISISCDE